MYEDGSFLRRLFRRFLNLLRRDVFRIDRIHICNVELQGMTRLFVLPGIFATTTLALWFMITSAPGWTNEGMFSDKTPDNHLR